MTQQEQQDAAINAAIDLLRRNGYSVTLPTGDFRPETPSQFQARHGISTALFARRVNESGCPAFTASRGDSGRIRTLTSNPDLEAWMQPRQ